MTTFPSSFCPSSILHSNNMHFKCRSFSTCFPPKMQTHAATLQSGRCCPGACAPQWRVVTPSATPPTPGFCKGSRCAAAVKQEIPPHPRHSTCRLCSSKTSAQPVRTNPSEPHTVHPSQIHSNNNTVHDVLSEVGVVMLTLYFS